METQKPTQSEPLIFENFQLPPVQLDMQKLFEFAQEKAMEAAKDEISSFYTRWNSSFRQELKKYLESKSAPFQFDIPCIVDQLNKVMSSEVDLIAKEAISLSIIPGIKELLTKGPEKINFAVFLTKLYSSCSHKFDRISVKFVEEDNYWSKIEFSFDREVFLAYFHKTKDADVYQ